MDTQTESLTDEQGPRVTGEQVRDFTRLRRTSTDRYVGGVAGGIARHLDLDPTLVRVVLAVLAFFGGAGLLVYAAVWLLVPADGDDRAPLHLGPDVAKVLVLVAVAVAGLVVLGVPWSAGGGAWLPWPLLLVVLAGTWLVVRRRGRGSAGSPPPGAPAAPTASYDAPTAAAAGPLTTADTTAPPAPPVPPAAPATWGPPPPPLPPRPRRTGVVLFWPTLAATALALGVLGLVDTGTDVPSSAYAALGLTVTALGLLVGAFRARPGGLVALGLVWVLALGATSLADATRIGTTWTETRVAPTSATELREVYRVDNGAVTLDLSGIPAADLAGRDVRVEMGTGQLTALLPADVDAVVDGRVATAGGLYVDGEETGGGFGVSSRSVLDGGGGGGRSLDLDLDLRLGAIDVRTR